MPQFDRAKIGVEPAPWAASDVRVRYGDAYAGAVRKADFANYYICCVSRERGGKSSLRACGKSGSIERGAESVAYEWWRLHESGDA